MIVRILTEGQWQLSDEVLEALNELDDQLEQAVEAGDEATFETRLAELLDTVRARGTRVADDALVDSDFLLPPSDASLDEVRQMLTEEGLVPD